MPSPRIPQPGLQPGDVATILAALTEAAAAKRDAVIHCPDCPAEADGGFCPPCEYRMNVAEEYDALARRLRDGAR